MQKSDQKNKKVGIIPARFASTRFPGKPLIEIDGKSMIQRVYEQCCKSDLDMAIVATDDQRIKSHVEKFGGNVIMTKTTHQTGTDRCAEVAENLLEAEVILNVQGDEPFIDPNDINKVITLLTAKKYEIATLAKQMDNYRELENPNVVKVVFAKNNQALFFSRAPIPYDRNKLLDKSPASSKSIAGVMMDGQLKYFRHIGLYGFQKQTLLQVAKLPQSDLEKTESLEQLRWLENGYKIGIDITTSDSISVDTPEDLQDILEKLNT